jgi:hypothetical protein
MDSCEINHPAFMMQSFVPKALAPCKTGRGQVSTIKKLEIVLKESHSYAHAADDHPTQLRARMGDLFVL